MKRLVLFAAILAGMAVSVHAQTPPAPTPAPELKKAGYFIGSWNLEGEMKPGPMGPGGKMTMTEEDKWMDGGFFVVGHSKFSSASMGGGTAISFIGYNPDQKVYTYDEFNSMGEVEHSTGIFEGDTWTWTGDQKMGDKTIKGRFTMKILTPNSYSFKFEMSPDGNTWNTVMDGTATRVK